MTWSRRPLPSHLWHEAELAPWHGLAREAVEPVLREEAARYASVLLFNVRGIEVSVCDKGDSWPDLPGADLFYNSMRIRAECYRRFFEDALTEHGSVGDGLLAIDLDDLHAHEPTVPIFSFQKTRGSRRLLVPDVDSLVLDFYAAPEFRDHLAFDEKAERAVFVGSTTGDLPITAAHVTQRLNARIRAALFFKDEPLVDFDLPSVVQFDSEETASLIRELDVAGRRRDWAEQFGYRFLLSIDGNGATCSRVAIALHSNAVLVKYRSIHELHYFKGLVPGRHFLSVESDQEALAVVRDAKRRQLSHRRIAARSRRFAREHINRQAAMRYTADLLNGYLARFGDTQERTDDCIEAHRHRPDRLTGWWGRIVAAARRFI